MAEEFDLIADIREDQGKGASRRLRHEGKVPAIIYGAGRPPRALVFDHNKVLRQLENESFYSSVLNIKVGDKSQAAILKDVQRHPAKNQVMHMDFQRIVEDEEIRMNVPLHFIGEDVAPGVKQDGGNVSHLITDVEVTCLPRDLPEYLEIDVSNLGLDEMLHLSDIKVPDGVTLTDLAQGPDNDYAVVSIQVVRAAPIEEEESEGEAVEPGQVPTAADEEAASDESDKD
jgi:large subunit ribosomal protein L25